MKISFLVIASEILEGKVQDINTLNLSKFLKSHHYSLEQVITVADREDQILNCLELLNSNDLVVISGGLGPTPDDLTKGCIARFLNKTLKASDESTTIATKNFSNQGRTYPTGHPYELIPQGSKPLLNLEGYAPGILFKKNGTTYISLPGVPREFKSMIEMHLPSLFNDEGVFIEDFLIRTRGIGEEAIFSKLDPQLWNKLLEFGATASLPYLNGVDITIRLQGHTSQEITEKKNQLHSYLQTHSLLPYIWHIGPESLEECIIKKAKELGVRFGFAESCTGGLCSDKITNVNGSSSVFYGSIVCYHAEIKTNLLQVDPHSITEFDVVSTQVAKEMAQGLRSRFPIDIAISLTGYAGPHDKEKEIPVGTVCIGVSSPLGDFSSQYHFRGDRIRLKEYFYQVASFQLLETLEKLASR